MDRVLIMDSDDDPLLPRSQSGLARLYPTAIVHPEAYLAFVRRFLDGGVA